MTTPTVHPVNRPPGAGLDGESRPTAITPTVLPCGLIDHLVVKTNTSARTVELPDVVVVALRQHLTDSCDAVEVDDDTDRRRPVRRAARLLFKGVGGEPVNAAASHTWASAREAVGLPARWALLRARPDPAAHRRRARPTRNGGHAGCEPGMTAVS
ncbi:hypothetical protein AB0B39_21445 [Micromonospora sp. NPDC049114]|uniref:hypothetical protein n=1 Tax=unclassified Micromonospora TaxID=2617518 RepID=UPI0033D64305